MKRIVIIVGLLVVALIMPLSATELPQVKELMVVGSGKMVAGNVGKARQDAILNALKEAVRVSLLEFIPSSILEENTFALDMEIFSRVTQYVHTFKILSETGRADGHEVLLQARYHWYREFEDFLREDLDFIRGVQLRSVMTGEFTMDIELIGGIQSLLDVLTTKEFEGFFLEINQALEDQVVVRFIPRETSGS